MGPGGSNKSITPLRQRWALAARILAAVFGGYAVAALSTVCLAQALPLPRADATLAATMLSFLIYSLAVLWVFAAASTARACSGLAASALLLVAGIVLI